MSDIQDKKSATQKVTWVGAVVNTALAIAQLVGGFLTSSQALIADGFHTLSDLVSDFVVLFASHHAHKEADDEHPYGHGRIETVATVVLGLMLAGVAVGIFMRAWERLLADEVLLSPHPWALAFAVLAIVAKESLFHYTMRTAKRVKSKLLEANAWHHRSDVISSAVVFLGIAGAQLGFAWLDAVAALVVAVMILYMAGRMILDSTLELVDTGMDPEQAESVRQFIAGLSGVVNVHMLRTRSMGGQIFADAHIQVESHISVSEGHRVAESVMQQLKARFPEVNDVTMHIDPEDDEVARPSADLPLREEVLATLSADRDCMLLMGLLDNVILHYIDGMVEVDVFLPDDVAPVLVDKFKAAAVKLDYIRSVNVFRQL
uniref:Cobalt-zinc-cadmium resistance protein n=1 Tax=uncultured Thiotrichaceae bacterium TaxID=298394 RepID=A0A6S6SZA8_9GAMM|nr:MAG: Cobalt-zinc-cadmium resistance protein [uncultured Thiotrichaceae bacterium]